MDTSELEDRMGETAQSIEERAHTPQPTAPANADGTDTTHRKRHRCATLATLVGALPRAWRIAVPAALAAMLIGLAGVGGYHWGWFDRTPLVIDKTNNVVVEVKKIGQFTTTCVIEELALKETRIDTNHIAGITTHRRNEIVLIGKGRVNAGFDLSKLSEQDVRQHKDTLFITLPPAEVFEIIMNPSDFETFYEKGLWSHELTKPLKAQARQRLLDDAARFRILEKAETYGIQRLTELFKGFGYKNVVITIDYNTLQDNSPLR